MLIATGNEASQNNTSLTDRLSQKKVATAGASLGAIALLELLLNKNKRGALLGRKSLHREFLKRLLNDKDTQVASAQGIAGLIALLWGGYQISRDLPEKPIIPVQPQIQPHSVSTSVGTGQNTAATAGNRGAIAQPTRTATPPVADKPATPAPTQAAPRVSKSPAANQAATGTTPPAIAASKTRTLRRNSKPREEIVIPVTTQPDPKPKTPMRARTEEKIKTPTPPVTPTPDRQVPASTPKLITNARTRLEKAGIPTNLINSIDTRLKGARNMCVMQGTIRETLAGKNIDDELTEEQYGTLLAFFQDKKDTAANKPKPVMPRVDALTASAPAPAAATRPIEDIYTVAAAYKGDVEQIRSHNTRQEMAKFLLHSYPVNEFNQNHFAEDDNRFISPTDNARLTELAQSGQDFSYLGDGATAKLFKIPFARFQKVQPNGYCGYRAITGEFTASNGKANSHRLCQHAKSTEPVPTNTDGNLEGDYMLNEDLFDDLKKILPCPVIFLQPYGHTDTALVFVYENGIMPEHPDAKLTPIILLKQSSQQAGHFDRYVQGNSYVKMEIPEYIAGQEINPEDIRLTETLLIPQEQLDQAGRA